MEVAGVALGTIGITARLSNVADSLKRVERSPGVESRSLSVYAQMCKESVYTLQELHKDSVPATIAEALQHVVATGEELERTATRRTGKGASSIKGDDLSTKARDFQDSALMLQITTQNILVPKQWGHGCDTVALLQDIRMLLDSGLGVSAPHRFHNRNHRDDTSTLRSSKTAMTEAASLVETVIANRKASGLDLNPDITRFDGIFAITSRETAVSGKYDTGSDGNFVPRDLIESEGMQALVQDLAEPLSFEGLDKHEYSTRQSIVLRWRDRAMTGTSTATGASSPAASASMSGSNIPATAGAANISGTSSNTAGSSANQPGP